MTPKGHQQTVSARLRGYRLRKDIVGLRAYLQGEEFAGHWLAMSGALRETILEQAAKTLAECRVCLPQPKRRGAIRWWDEARIEKLRQGFAAGWTNDQAALALGVSPGAINCARFRYLPDTTSRHAA